MNLDGTELRRTADGRGEGVFATKSFRVGETVMVGVIERRLDKNHSHATQVGRSEYVELAGLGPKANHSCDPNCGIHINESGAPDMVARRFVARDEEVTFDYAMRNYSIEYFPIRCGCGSPICRGTVTGWKDLPDELKRSYRGFITPYLLDIDEMARSPFEFEPPPEVDPHAVVMEELLATDGGQASAPGGRVLRRDAEQ